MNQAREAGWEPEADPEYGQRLIPYLIRRYRWMLLAGLILGALLFGVVSLLTPPSYSTRGTLHVTKGGTGANLLRGVPFVGASSPLEDEIQILRSREIGLQVIDELGLQVEVYDPKGADAPLQRILGKFGLRRGQGSREEQYSRLTVRDVSVSPDMLSSKHRWISADAEGNWQSRTQQGAAGEALETSSYTLLPVFGATHQAGDRYLLTVKPDHQAWSDYLGALTVRPASMESNVIEVRFAHPNPLIAKLAVEMILQKYLEFNQEKTYGDLDALLEFIAGETLTVEQQLSELTDELSTYREESQVYSEAAQGSTAVQSMANLSSTRTGYQIQLRQIDNVLAMIGERTPAEVCATIQAPATNLPIEQELVSRLADLIQNLRTAQETMTPEHPRMIDLQGQINTVLGQIRDSLVTARANTQVAIGSLSGDISQLKTQLASLPEASGKIALLTGEIEANQQVLALLREQEADTKLRRAGTSTEVRLLDTPPMPARRDRPRIMRDVALGMVAGMVIAVLVLLVIESSRRGFRSLRELRSRLGLRILGVLPGSVARRQRQTSASAVSYVRRLLPAVSAADEPIAVVWLGTPRAGLDLSWALSTALDQQAAPTLLIDADQLQAELSRTLNKPGGPGLVEACAAPDKLAELAIEVDESRRFLGPGQGALTAEGVKAALATAGKKYERTIICLPRPGQWADQAVWSTALNHVILAVPQGAVTCSEIAAAVGQLSELEIAVRGAVVTNFSAAHDPLGREELALAAVPPLGRT